MAQYISFLLLKFTACPKDTYQNGVYDCTRCPANAVTSGVASVQSDCTCESGYEADPAGPGCRGEEAPF